MPNEGKISAAGSVETAVNPRFAKSSGIPSGLRTVGQSVTARLSSSGLTVRCSATVAYGQRKDGTDRTVNVSTDTDGGKDLKALLEGIMAREQDTLIGEAEDAAHVARSYARNNQEEL